MFEKNTPYFLLNLLATLLANLSRTSSMAGVLSGQNHLLPQYCPSVVLLPSKPAVRKAKHIKKYAVAHASSLSCVIYTRLQLRMAEGRPKIIQQTTLPCTPTKYPYVGLHGYTPHNVLQLGTLCRHTHN